MEAAQGKKSKIIPLFAISFLTYGSMTGEGSFGEWLSKKNPEIVFSQRSESTSLLGALRVQKLKKEKPSQFVLGLSEGEYKQALQEKRIEEGVVYSKSPYVFLVNTEGYKGPLKMEWQDVPRYLEKKVIMQDPRSSSMGVGFLELVYESKVINELSAKKMIKRTFPSWSSSYDFFLKNKDLVVWTFATSLAWHVCEEKSEKYKALEILNSGYPIHQEWLAPVTGHGLSKQEVQKVFNFYLEAETQKALAQKLWMFPAKLNDSDLPKCFEGSKKIKGVANNSESFKKSQEWLDKWFR